MNYHDDFLDDVLKEAGDVWSEGKTGVPNPISERGLLAYLRDSKTLIKTFESTDEEYEKCWRIRVVGQQASAFFNELTMQIPHFASHWEGHNWEGMLMSLASVGYALFQLERRFEDYAGKEDEPKGLRLLLYKANQTVRLWGNCISPYYVPFNQNPASQDEVKGYRSFLNHTALREMIKVGDEMIRDCIANREWAVETPIHAAAIMLMNLNVWGLEARQHIYCSGVSWDWFDRNTVILTNLLVALAGVKAEALDIDPDVAIAAGITSDDLVKLIEAINHDVLPLEDARAAAKQGGAALKALIDSL